MSIIGFEVLRKITSTGKNTFVKNINNYCKNTFVGHGIKLILIKLPYFSFP